MGTKEMEVVKNLDTKRYMGRWYEIASFPSRNQPKDGVNTRATYTLNQDGTVHVLNETWSAGKRGCLEGSAYKADPSSDEAKLKILSRTPHLDEEIFNRLVEKASEVGYDVKKLKKTPQVDPPPESDNTPKDATGIWWIKSVFGK